MMIWFCYNILFAVGFAALLPKYLLRMRRRGGYRKDFLQRFGLYRPDVRAALAGGGRIWVHAVSVGEIAVAFGFMDEWRRRRPDARFLLTTNTSTAHAIARARVRPPDALVYFPLDLPTIVRRVFRRARPAALVLVECELWPNLIRRAAREGVPVYLVNGRISEKSFRGYRRLRFLTRRLLPQFQRLFAQTESDRERLAALGAPAERLRVMGSAKYELASGSDEGRARAGAILRAAGFPEGGPVWLAGSTWPGEEAIALDVHAAARARLPGLGFVLAPRHVERAPEILAEIERRGWRALRRSALAPGAPPAAAPPDVLLLDTTGELKDFYTAADVVFVGKSLTQHGGQNPIEPAALGKAILIGPHTENFSSVMEDFRAADAAIVVRSPEEWRDRLLALLNDAPARAALGGRAAALVRAKAGALRRTVEEILADFER